MEQFYNARKKQKRSEYFLVSLGICSASVIIPMLSIIFYSTPLVPFHFDALESIPFHLHNLTLHIIFANTFHSCRVLGPPSHYSFAPQSGNRNQLGASVQVVVSPVEPRLEFESVNLERRPERTLIKAVVKQVCLIDRAYAKNKKKARTKRDPKRKALIPYLLRLELKLDSIPGLWGIFAIPCHTIRAMPSVPPTADQRQRLRAVALLCVGQAFKR